ncbi:MAG TPA: YgeY family selenium metabolism-linked hydrolase [Bacillota bacterium]|nr:YgeY family selenium metabolism-linked hydrolase [Fastidiosipila sp.]HPX93483.1 YgeY family selenium metabolism-linked hydrolase [Bacillota bacterium]HQB81254.1 YgeY family selenium metabolism-linked hydrolase [Bacillota bacterium]
MDYDRIRQVAESYKEDMVKFLRDLIRIPGESCGEEGVARRIKEEMEKLGYDKVEFDQLGNVLGWMGTGDRIIAYDGHIDTVGIGEITNWKFDPYEGYENETEVGGRGASDQLGGVVSSVYGVRMAKDLGLIDDDVTLLVTGTVQEEDCDGMCWLHLIENEKIKPEFVVSTEPTDMHVYRGHRGRMEIRVEVKGISCHGSAPERGENAIYKMADILKEIEELNNHLKDDPFLGKGTVTTSQIFYTSPSRCAVADSCAISLDRRLTWGETWESAIAEIEALPSVKKHGAVVTMYKYDRPSWTGFVYEQECFFPTWVIPGDAPQTRALVDAYTELYGAPKVDKWTFSTNGVAIMGRHGIPCIGLGPGKEAQAHAPNEITWKEDLVRCAAIYSVMPKLYVDITKEA